MREEFCADHTNGLIRDFFPKGTDFSTIANAEVAKVERLLNARPRKSLGFRSPGGCTGQLGDFGQFGFALDQSAHAAFASSAAAWITLPVSQTSFAHDDSRPLGNVDSIGDQAAPGVLAGTFL